MRMDLGWSHECFFFWFRLNSRKIEFVELELELSETNTQKKDKNGFFW